MPKPDSLQIPKLPVTFLTRTLADDNAFFTGYKACAARGARYHCQGSLQRTYSVFVNFTSTCFPDMSEPTQRHILSHKFVGMVACIKAASSLEPVLRLTASFCRVMEDGIHTPPQVSCHPTRWHSQFRRAATMRSRCGIRALNCKTRYVVVKHT